MVRFGAELSRRIQPGAVIFFHGELGAGKTTLIRGILHGLGYTGFVKSPSYTLVELYEVHGLQIVHADLYRIEDERAVQQLGLSDYLGKNSILLIEWAEKAEDYLPSPTIRCTIDIRKGTVASVSIASRGINLEFRGTQKTPRLR